jgi:hypothetical protein
MFRKIIGKTFDSINITRKIIAFGRFDTVVSLIRLLAQIVIPGLPCSRTIYHIHSIHVGNFSNYKIYLLDSKLCVVCTRSIFLSLFLPLFRYTFIQLFVVQRPAWCWVFVRDIGDPTQNRNGMKKKKKKLRMKGKTFKRFINTSTVLMVVKQCAALLTVHGLRWHKKCRVEAFHLYLFIRSKVEAVKQWTLGGEKNTE